MITAVRLLYKAISYFIRIVHKSEKKSEEHIKSGKCEDRKMLQNFDLKKCQIDLMPFFGQKMKTSSTWLWSPSSRCRPQSSSEPCPRWSPRWPTPPRSPWLLRCRCRRSTPSWSSWLRREVLKQSRNKTVITDVVKRMRYEIRIPLI